MNTAAFIGIRLRTIVLSLLLAVLTAGLVAVGVKPAVATGSYLTGNPAIFLGANGYAGTDAAYAIDSNGNLETSYQSPSNYSWGSWSSLGGSGLADSGNLQGSPDIVIAPNTDAPIVFAISTKGNLWANWQSGDGGDWYGWTNLGGSSLTGSPDVFLNSDNIMTAFAISSSGHLMTAWQTSEGSGDGGPGSNWTSSWTSLGGSNLTGSPVIVNPNSLGGVTAFAINSSGNLMTNWQSSAGGTWQSSWTSLGGSGLSDGGQLAGSPYIVNTSSGAVAFAISSSPEGNLWTAQQSSAGGLWGSWDNLGGGN